jgi:hypothetical protein
MNTDNYSNFLHSNAQHSGAWARSLGACRKMMAKFNQLRERLIEKLSNDAYGLVPEAMVEQAVLEAEALAWSTPYPLLFLPELAEEKVNNAGRWALRQHQVLARQRALATVAI